MAEEGGGGDGGGGVKDCCERLIPNFKFHMDFRLENFRSKTDS